MLPPGTTTASAVFVENSRTSGAMTASERRSTAEDVRSSKAGTSGNSRAFCSASVAASVAHLVDGAYGVRRPYAQSCCPESCSVQVAELSTCFDVVLDDGPS